MSMVERDEGVHVTCAHPNNPLGDLEVGECDFYTIFSFGLNTLARSDWRESESEYEFNVYLQVIERDCAHMSEVLFI